MNINEVVVKPLLTEKSNQLRESRKYSFAVNPLASKVEIIRAIQNRFNVSIISCNVISVKGKPKRLRQASGSTSSWKKAIVTLQKGDSITVFEGV